MKSKFQMNFEELHIYPYKLIRKTAATRQLLAQNSPNFQGEPELKFQRYCCENQKNERQRKSYKFCNTYYFDPFRISFHNAAKILSTQNRISHANFVCLVHC